MRREGRFGLESLRTEDRRSLDDGLLEGQMLEVMQRVVVHESVQRRLLRQQLRGLEYDRLQRIEPRIALLDLTQRGAHALRLVRVAWGCSDLAFIESSPTIEKSSTATSAAIASSRLRNV